MLKDNRSPSIAAVCALFLLSGCDWLRPGGPPDEAGVEVSSADVDKAALIISQHFAWVDDPDCDGDGPGCDPQLQVISADTTVVDLPHSRTIKFTSRLQLLVESYPDLDEAARLGMRVTIDGDERYNNFATLLPATDSVPRQSLYFAYTFGGRPLNTGTGVGGG